MTTFRPCTPGQRSDRLDATLTNGVLKRLVQGHQSPPTEDQKQAAQHKTHETRNQSRQIGGPEFRPKPLDPAEGATWDRADDEEMKLLKLALWNHEPDEEAQELEDFRLSLVSLLLEEEDGPIDGQEKEESMPAERLGSENEMDGRLRQFQ